MKAWWSRQSLERRLTALYAATVLATLALLAPAVYVLIEQRLHSVMDRQLSVDLALFQATLAVDTDGQVRRRAESGPGGDHAGTRYAWYEVWSDDGRLLLRSRPKGRDFAPSLPRSPQPAASVSYSARLEGGDEVRILERPFSGEHPRLVLRGYRDEAGLHRTLRQIVIGFVLGAPLAALLAAGGGFLMTRRALAPVAAMADEARRITSDSLGLRLSVANPHDELGELASVFNETLERLERSFAELHRFTADASHELRTPLTALRSVGEIGLREARGEAGLRQAIASMLEESEKLDEILEALLVLARGEAGHPVIRLERVGAREILAAARERLEVLADERRQGIEVDCDPQLHVRAEPHLLLLALTNLLHNAIRYSPPDTTIVLAARRAGTSVALEVRDEGPGIPEGLRERVFERFFRVDDARSREQGGTGLGLSIARLFVQQLGGTIELDVRPGGGSTFRILLPAAGA